MKRTIIGGFLSIIGSVWTLAIAFMAANNLVSGWTTPPGRFLTTVLEMGLTFMFALGVLFVVVGIAIMAIEFSRKDS
ncbi:MAG: hypothetical protein MRZ98_07655 [Clostridiales bacterium]|nr:hypothetical protein [Clostridiales bacterium]